MLNPFFLNGTQSEQGLVQDLINEQLRMYGIEVYYLPRTYATTNKVIREVIQSEFNDAYPIEAYVDSYEGYGGQGTILSKFGIQNLDDLTITISRERYENYISPLIRNIPNSELTSRPKEGDLIYFPLGDRIFEIKYVEHEQPFYQLKKNYVYQLKCELFRYEDEVLDTGIGVIDDEVENIGYIQTLKLIGSASMPTATVGICSLGAVNRVTITNMGGGYTSAPNVGFSSAPDGGVTAIGIASITDRYYNCFGDASGKVQSVDLINAGCGYSEAPWSIMSGGNGTGAASTTGISTNGSVQFVTITDGGSGYTTNPTITFTPQFSNFSNTDETFDSNEDTFDETTPVGILTGYGYGVINSVGVVTAAYIRYGGENYNLVTGAFATIEQPPGIGSTIGIGTYVFNEVVTGQTSGTTARVNSWDINTHTLTIKIVDGSFTSGELIIGEESEAAYIMRGQNTDDLITPFADNDNIESEADEILDFSSSNPFGMP